MTWAVSVTLTVYLLGSHVSHVKKEVMKESIQRVHYPPDDEGRDNYVLCMKNAKYYVTDIGLISYSYSLNLNWVIVIKLNLSNVRFNCEWLYETMGTKPVRQASLAI